MKFSDRVGLTVPKNTIQKDTMDDALKNSLWNIFKIYIFAPADESTDYTSITYIDFKSFYIILWCNFFKLPLNYKPSGFKDIESYIFDYWFSKATYLDIYNLIQFIVDTWIGSRKELIKSLNFILKRELSAYKFIDGQLSPITTDEEASEIEQALDTARKSKLVGVEVHLKTALVKFSDRKNPDYRNCITESVSAVESIAKIITGKPKATLGDALKVIEDKVDIHGALKEGLNKMYGYTSDEGGLRHAMLNLGKIDSEDARFMLVSCSAFINYLKVKADKAGIKLH